jgi:DNA polymerase-3 subunit beta
MPTLLVGGHLYFSSQLNFVNPGLFLYNLGIDATVTPKLKASFNLNYLQFHRTESLELLATDTYAVWRGDGIYLSSRLVDGTYPDYRQIIPSSFECQGEITRADLVRALKILSVFLSRDSRRIALQVKPQRGSLEVRVEGSEAGQGEVSVEFEGTGAEVQAFFNITYLLDGAAHGRSEKISFGFGGGSSPVVLRPAGDTRSLYMVMPIQV